MVKNLPTNAEHVGDTGSVLGQKDPLEKEMATYSSILAWRIPWTEEPGGYSPWGCKEFYTTEHTYTTAKLLGLFYQLLVSLMWTMRYLYLPVSLKAFRLGV